MAKRKNDEIAGIPIWLWVVVPVLLVVMGGAGILIGQWLASRNINMLPVETPTIEMPPPTFTPLYTITPSATPPATLTPTPAGYVQPTNASLDVVILIDTTGSMGDEIAQLQNNFLVVSGEIATRFQGADVRYGLVAYK